MSLLEFYSHSCLVSFKLAIISELHVTVLLFYNLMPIMSIDISPTPINMLLVCDICIEIEINACYGCHVCMVCV